MKIIALFKTSALMNSVGVNEFIYFQHESQQPRKSISIEIMVKYGLRLSNNLNYLLTFSMQMEYVYRETYISFASEKSTNGLLGRLLLYQKLYVSHLSVFESKWFKSLK